MDGDDNAKMGTVGVQALPAEEISPDETALAEKLRNLCDSFGIEHEENLADSADVLFSLGEMYFKKAQETEGMLQKLSYIRCSALLNGAKVRFKQTGNTCKVCDVGKILVKLNSSILTSAGITEKGEEMLQFSMKLRKNIKEVREEATQRVANIPVINDYGDIEKEKEKIKKVRFENVKNTDLYLNLARKISKKVEELLGAPPCKFAIVGLGSLARQEITLYSDFEHVIVLDDAVKQKNDDEYKNIIEYFRWFTVIFEGIMIGLEETFIPSVSIKSLNDHYTDDKSKNWFYDAFTPCGIAFDGMVPHSCNTPLGRQQATEKRKHIVELIQPASKMAKFLTKDEEIKNGYYLQDILSRTCFVYGNEEVYKVYLSEVRQIQESQSVDEILRKEKEKMYQNRNEDIWNIWYANDHETKYDIKAELYRPIITWLGSYARVNAITDECASFDIILRLHEKGIIDSQFAHELEYAVAVGCEARMKVYALSASERNAMTMKEFADFVGMESAIKCKEVIADLRERFEKVAVKTSHQDLSHEDARLSMLDKMVYKSEILMSFGYFEEAIKLSEEIIVQCEGIGQTNPCRNTEILRMILATKHVLTNCYSMFIDSENPQSGEYCRKCEEVCVDALTCDVTVLGRYMCTKTLCNLYATQNRPQEFIEMSELGKRYYHGEKLLDKMVSRQNLFSIHFSDFEMRQQITEWDKMLDYLKSELEAEDAMNSQILLRCHIAITQIGLGQIESGRKELLHVLTEIIQNARWINKSEYVALLHMIGTEQMKQTWDYDFSIAAIEECQALLAPNRAGDVHLVSQEREVCENVYKGACQWRKANNLPLQYSKLNIWDEYKRISPYFGDESMEMALQSGLLGDKQTQIARDEILRLSETADDSKFSRFHVSESSHLHQMYNAAVTDFLHCNFMKSAQIMWNIANNERAGLKRKACEFLMHIVYCYLMRSRLRDTRDFHAKTLPIKGKGQFVDKYNKAANDLFLLKIPESAADLWSILLNCDEKEHHVWRQALALVVFMLQRQVRCFKECTATALLTV